MKTEKQTLQEKTWRGTIVSKEIKAIGDLKHYIFTFGNGGCIHTITNEILSITTNDIITFNCTVHGSMFFASNIKKIGSKFQNKKVTKLQNTYRRVKGF